MAKSTGGGGNGGRKNGGGSGDAGQPGEVFREAEKIQNPYGLKDSRVTSWLRDNYKNAPVNVSIIQMRGDVTSLSHAMGTAHVDAINQRVTVIPASSGKRYTYKDTVKGLNMWESLAGFKT